MLLEMRVANFAVIEEAELSFGSGLTVLTGETGAGKSILVDALGLLAGGRADAHVVRASCSEAIVEGLFSLDPVLEGRMQELGLPVEGGEVRIRRTVGATGRGRATVNGSLVAFGTLAKLLRGAVDISGQHEHMSLLDPTFHAGLLDRLAGTEACAAAYRQVFDALKALDARLQELGGDESQMRARLEFAEFQLEELRRLEAFPGEESALELERRRLADVEKLRRSAGAAHELLSLQETSVSAALAKAAAALGEGARVDTFLQHQQSRLQGAQADLEDIASSLDGYVEHLNADPRRLTEVEDRLDDLRRTARKHGTDVAGLAARRAKLEEEVQGLQQRKITVEQLQIERGTAETAARQAARALTAARERSAKALQTSVVQSLRDLAMPGSQFEVRIAPEQPLSRSGADEVEFYFSANPGEPLRPLSKVASGGEASRLLLSLRAALAGSDLCGCYVLDEADAGVSGGVAEVVGRMIRSVGQHRQVLCITHLPQVAVYADGHVAIRKEVRAGRTLSRWIPLIDEAARTQELARMLSGVEVTQEAVSAAQALVRSARRSVQSVTRPKRHGLDAQKRAARIRRSA